MARYKCIMGTKQTCQGWLVWFWFCHHAREQILYITSVVFSCVLFKCKERQETQDNEC